MDFTVSELLVYNLAKRACGKELAVAQGGWENSAHDRYERFALQTVHDMPSAMIAATAVLDAAALPAAPLVQAAPPVAAAAPAIPPPPRVLPPGRKRKRGTRVAGGGSATATNGTATILVTAPGPRPLTVRDCVGRAVLCPASMWPRSMAL